LLPVSTALKVAHLGVMIAGNSFIRAGTGIEYQVAGPPRNLNPPEPDSDSTTIGYMYSESKSYFKFDIHYEYKRGSFGRIRTICCPGLLSK